MGPGFAARVTKVQKVKVRKSGGGRGTRITCMWNWAGHGGASQGGGTLEEGKRAGKKEGKGQEERAGGCGEERVGGAGGDTTAHCAEPKILA